MIVAHLADLHITERRGDTGESLDEQVERLVWCGKDAHRAGAGVLLVAGDVFDHLSSIAERNAAIDVFSEWTQATPVVLVYGNHDRPGDLHFLSRLRSPHEVHVFDRPGFHETPRGIQIGCLPWPRKAWLAASGVDRATDLEQVAAQQMRQYLLTCAQAFDRHSGPSVLLSHLELGAALTDSGQPLTGKADIELSETDLIEVEADYVALGHIHKHQVLQDRICYAGAPRQCTFGEDPAKGYCLVDVERGRAPDIDHRRAPGRELVTVVGKWDGEAVSFDTEPSAIPTTAIVRLKYEAPESARRAAAESAEAYARAFDGRPVKVDARVIPVHRSRSQEIRKARSNADRIEALWKSREQRPERAIQILEKLVTVESEVAA